MGHSVALFEAAVPSNLRHKHALGVGKTFCLEWKFCSFVYICTFTHRHLLHRRLGFPSFPVQKKRGNVLECNFEARSSNHGCRREAISTAYSEFVCVTLGIQATIASKKCPPAHIHYTARRYIQKAVTLMSPAVRIPALTDLGSNAYVWYNII
jgi:hypothetical protein